MAVDSKSDSRQEKTKIFVNIQVTEIWDSNGS